MIVLREETKNPVLDLFLGGGLDKLPGGVLHLVVGHRPSQHQHGRQTFLEGAPPWLVFFCSGREGEAEQDQISQGKGG